MKFGNKRDNEYHRLDYVLAGNASAGYMPARFIRVLSLYSNSKS